VTGQPPVRRHRSEQRTCFEATFFPGCGLSRKGARILPMSGSHRPGQPGRRGVQPQAGPLKVCPPQKDRSSRGSTGGCWLGRGPRGGGGWGEGGGGAVVFGTARSSGTRPPPRAWQAAKDGDKTGGIREDRPLRAQAHPWIPSHGRSRLGSASQ
jgi:hypothetical protein